MRGRIRAILGLLAGAIVLLASPSLLWADGGAVRLSARKGSWQITVFTSPTPVRAGPVDVSVFVQDAATGEPIAAANVAVRVTPRGRPNEAMRQEATRDKAINKLFQDAIFEFSESGWWDVLVLIDGLGASVELSFELEAAEPLPRLAELTPWIAWPLAAIVLFLVHRGLVARQERRQRAKKGQLPRMGTGPDHVVAQST